MAIKLIKDPIHGNNTFSGIEDKVFGLSIYNRLHHVLQNSCAYLVYPSNKTSRFTHSVGVMRLATSLFNSGLANCEEKVLISFFDDKLKVIEKIIKKNDFLHGINGVERDKYKITLKKYNEEKILENEKYLEHLQKQIGYNFLNHISINSRVFNDNKHYTTYLLLLQALRLFALLHDIGHLPFSHLSEFAISEIYSQLSDKETLTEKEKSFVDDYEKMISIFGNKTQIHEVIGKKIIKLILFKISNDYENIKEEKECLHLNVITTQLLLKILEEIFKNQKGELFSLYEIIDGEMDVDRIEYSARDGNASGLFEKTGDVERIMKLSTLSTRYSEDGVNYKDGYHFYPAIQTLNDIQELFTDRYRIYKFIVNHHKVKRYDYILQKCIELIIKKELLDNVNNEETLKQFNLSSMIDTIFTLLNEADKIALNNKDIERSFYQFTQLNDFWLLTMLNGELLNLIMEDNNERTAKFLETLLKEFFTTSRSFKSLWKKDFEYKKFCDTLGEDLRKIIDIKKIREIILKCESDKSEKCDIHKLFLGDLQKVFGITGNEWPKEISNYEIGRFIILHFFNNYNWTEKLFQIFYEKNKNVLIKLTNLKDVSGIIYVIDLKNHSSKFSLNDVSELPNYLRKDKINSIGFFVYYDDYNEIDLVTDLRTEFNKLIINYLM